MRMESRSWWSRWNPLTTAGWLSVGLIAFWVGMALMLVGGV